MSSLNLNRVCLAGHLTRDPVVRQTAGGTDVADLGLAINEEYTAKDGKTVQQTCFTDLIAWGKTAVAAGTHLKKGHPVLVEGNLITDQWETPQGEKRNKLRVRVNRIHFLNGSKPNGSNAPAGTAPAAANGARTTPSPAPDDDDPFGGL